MLISLAEVKLPHRVYSYFENNEKEMTSGNINKSFKKH